MPLKAAITEEQFSEVRRLFDQKIGARVIAKKLGLTRWAVQQIYKKLGIYNIGRKTPRTIEGRTEYQCRKCNIIKDISCFRIRKKCDRSSNECYCFDCEYILNIARAKTRFKQLKTNPNFRIRRNISYAIWAALKQTKSRKNGSCLDCLEYTIEELRIHLEAQFEPWMNWNNYGGYRKSWDDHNISTWTWNIDHIIPQSKLPYISMLDDNFLKCWSLDNLRPFSAKENLLKSDTTA